jgi:AraC-like DNA-binding protein
LDEAMHTMEWATEYRQLNPGKFSSVFKILEGDSWFLIEEQSSSALEVAAPAPPGMYVLALAEGDPGIANNQVLSSDHVFMQCPGSDLTVTLMAGMKVPHIGVTAELFEDVVHAVAPELPIPRASVNTIAIAPGHLGRIRYAMRSVLSAPFNQEKNREEAVSGILADIVTAVSDHVTPLSGYNMPALHARQALNKAREYIEAHLEEAIRVESVCHYSGVPLRSLERIFSRNLGISPQQYIKARRLNVVRRHLLATDIEQGLCVTDVALSHGFTHLGRFAGDYRRHFGESPRQTLLGR